MAFVNLKSAIELVTGGHPAQAKLRLDSLKHAAVHRLGKAPVLNATEWRDRRFHFVSFSRVIAIGMGVPSGTKVFSTVL